MATPSHRLRSRSESALGAMPPPVMPDTPLTPWQAATELRDPGPGDAADHAAHTEELTATHTDSVADRLSDEPTHEDIARAAYALYEARGGEQGRADEDWFTAEQQLRDERRGRRD